MHHKAARKVANGAVADYRVANDSLRASHHQGHSEQAGQCPTKADILP